MIVFYLFCRENASVFLAKIAQWRYNEDKFMEEQFLDKGGFLWERNSKAM